MDRNVVKRIMDYNLFCQARDLRSQLAPVAAAIDICQRDNTGLALACHTWLCLLKDEALLAHTDIAQRRFTQAIQPCHLVAYLLHPHHRGELLDDQQRQDAYQWLAEKNAEYVTAAIQFDTKSSPYPSSFFTATGTNPTVWWRGLHWVKLPKGFVETVANLQSAKASSASIERVLSSFGLIYTPSCMRNRLGIDKASKLCYRMLRGNDDLDY